jgi:hypothetical protein
MILLSNLGYLVPLQPLLKVASHTGCRCGRVSKTWLHLLSVTFGKPSSPYFDIATPLDDR